MTLTVHDDAPTGRLTPAIWNVGELAAPVNVGAGAVQPVEPAAGVAASTTPDGKVSSRPRLVTAAAPAGFENVKVKTEVCPIPIVPGAANALVTVGAPETVSVEFTLLVILGLRPVACAAPFT